MATLPAPYEQRPLPNPDRRVVTVSDPGRLARARGAAAAGEGRAAGELYGAEAEFGNAMARVSEHLYTIGRQIQERQDKQQYVEARHAFLQARLEADRELVDDDPATYESRFRDRLNVARDTLAEGLDNSAVKSDFMAEADGLILEGAVRVQDRALARERDIENAKRSGRQVEALESVTTADTATRQRILQSIGDDIALAVRAGYISHEEAFAESRRFSETYAATHLKTLADEDQVRVLTEANAGASNLQSFISPDNRVTLLNAASNRLQQRLEHEQSMRIASEERAYRLNERAEKDVETQAAAEGDSLLQSGGLTAEWLDSNSARLSAADRRFYLRELTEGQGSTDVELYADLRQRAGAGEDVRSEARDALQAGRLKIADYDKITNAAEQGGRGWAKRGEEYITRFLKPSELAKTGLEAQSYANAADDWQQWIRNNSQASDEQAESAYKRIAANYSMVKANEIRLSTTSPLYLVGGRSAPDLDATENATVEALERGAITAQEFQRQAALIGEWRRATQLQSAGGE